jgi:hypothetical protein
VTSPVLSLVLPVICFNIFFIFDAYFNIHTHFCFKYTQCR